MPLAEIMKSTFPVIKDGGDGAECQWALLFAAIERYFEGKHAEKSQTNGFSSFVML